MFTCTTSTVLHAFAAVCMKSGFGLTVSPVCGSGVLIMSSSEEKPPPFRKQKHVLQKVSISPVWLLGSSWTAPCRWEISSVQNRSVCVCVWPPEETESRKEEGRLLHRGEKPFQTEEAGAQRGGGGAHWCSGKLCSYLFRCAVGTLNFSTEFIITNVMNLLEFIIYWTQADKRTPPRKKDLGKSGIKTSSLFKHNPDIPEILR